MVDIHAKIGSDLKVHNLSITKESLLQKACKLWDEARWDGWHFCQTQLMSGYEMCFG